MQGWQPHLPQACRGARDPPVTEGARWAPAVAGRGCGGQAANATPTGGKETVARGHRQQRKLLRSTAGRNQTIPPCSRGQAGVGCDQGGRPSEDCLATAGARRRQGGDRGSLGTRGDTGADIRGGNLTESCGARQRAGGSPRGRAGPQEPTRAGTGGLRGPGRGRVRGHGPPGARGRH